MTSPKTAYIRNRPVLCLSALFLAVLIGLGIYQTRKPLPAGLSFESPLRPVTSVRFFRDLTWMDATGTRRTDQQIFDQVLTMISNARKMILIDMFLFNDFSGADTSMNRPVSSEIVDALISQKQKYPDMYISVITDPINTVYGGLASPLFEQLRDHRIHVTLTALDDLRDSNPLYSPLWRILIRPFGNASGDLLPNPFGAGRVSVRSYLKMLNFKANHRKVIITDDSNGLTAMVSSANPHDASSFHGNAAVAFSGPAVADLINAECAVLAFSGGPMPPDVIIPQSKSKTGSETKIQVITENKIKQAVLKALAKAARGDRIFLVMFYLSDREIVHSLQSAHQRGAVIRILLDPNKDAFGFTKNGIPNRQTAAELVRSGISVKWSDTHGEQAHTKMLLADYAGGHSTLISGSANYTRRNLDDYNLEADVAVFGPGTADIFNDARAYCDLLWNNTGGKQFSIDYQNYADDSWMRVFLYRWMETTGMCTF